MYLSPKRRQKSRKLNVGDDWAISQLIYANAFPIAFYSSVQPHLRGKDKLEPLTALNYIEP